jgi:hypothetical protein
MSDLWLPDGIRQPTATMPPPVDTVLDMPAPHPARRMTYVGEYGPDDSMRARVWDSGKFGIRVLVSLDDTRHGRLLHASVSSAQRDPMWAEIRAVRYWIFPASIDVMMVLPSLDDYVNVHEHCFHLWQTPREWGIR